MPAAPPRLTSLPAAADPVAADVLARAFWDDPVMAHLLPDDGDRYRRLQRLFAWSLGDGRRRGLAHAAHDLSAVTVWHAPGRHKMSSAETLRAAPAMLRVFPTSRLALAQRTLEATERHHPREPHWYLAIIGSDPGRRGVGAGRALLEPVLAMADEAGEPAYLESSKAENVPYYERFGFRITEELALPDDGPTVHLMWRDPQPT